MRGAAGERQEENALGGNPPFYKVGDAVDQGSGFPGAGTGDDEERPVAVGDGAGLFSVQLRGQVPGSRVDASFSWGIDKRNGGVARRHGGKISLRDGFGSGAVREVTRTQFFG